MIGNEDLFGQLKVRHRNISYLFVTLQIMYHTPRWVRSWVRFESLLFILLKIKRLNLGSIPALGTIYTFCKDSQGFGFARNHLIKVPP